MENRIVSQSLPHFSAHPLIGLGVCTSTPGLKDLYAHFHKRRNLTLGITYPESVNWVYCILRWTMHLHARESRIQLSVTWIQLSVFVYSMCSIMLTNISVYVRIQVKMKYVQNGLITVIKRKISLTGIIMLIMGLTILCNFQNTNRSLYFSYFWCTEDLS